MDERTARHQAEAEYVKFLMADDMPCAMTFEQETQELMKAFESAADDYPDNGSLVGPHSKFACKVAVLR